MSHQTVRLSETGQTTTLSLVLYVAFYDASVDYSDQPSVRSHYACGLKFGGPGKENRTAPATRRQRLNLCLEMNSGMHLEMHLEMHPPSSF